MQNIQLINQVQLINYHIY